MFIFVVYEKNNYFWNQYFQSELAIGFNCKFETSADDKAYEILKYLKDEVVLNFQFNRYVTIDDNLNVSMYG